MNPLLSRLQPYPFERLKKLFAGVTPNPAYRPISLGIGEPKHATPAFVVEALHQSALAQPSGLAGYPATAGEPALRKACTDAAGWSDGAMVAVNFSAAQFLFQQHQGKIHGRITRSPSVKYNAPASCIRPSSTRQSPRRWPLMPGY